MSDHAENLIEDFFYEVRQNPRDVVNSLQDPVVNQIFFTMLIALFFDIDSEKLHEIALAYFLSIPIAMFVSLAAWFSLSGIILYDCLNLVVKR